MDIRLRTCIFGMLVQSGVDLPDDALVMHGDLDEMSRGIDLYHLKHCELKPTALPLRINRRTAIAGSVRSLQKECTAFEYEILNSVVVVNVSHARQMNSVAFRGNHWGTATPSNMSRIVSGVHLVQGGGINDGRFLPFSLAPQIRPPLEHW